MIHEHLARGRIRTIILREITRSIRSDVEERTFGTMRHCHNSGVARSRCTAPRNDLCAGISRCVSRINTNTATASFLRRAFRHPKRACQVGQPETLPRILRPAHPYAHQHEHVPPSLLIVTGRGFVERGQRGCPQGSYLLPGATTSRSGGSRAHKPPSRDTQSAHGESLPYHHRTSLSGERDTQREIKSFHASRAGGHAAPISSTYREMSPRP